MKPSQLCRAIGIVAALILVGASAHAAPARRNTVTWNTDASGFWDVGSNWSGGVEPQAGDDVVIDRAGASPLIPTRAPTPAIATLQSTELLKIQSTLTVTSHTDFQGGMELSGVLAGSGTALLQSDGLWTAGQVTGGGL